MEIVPTFKRTAYTKPVLFPANFEIQSIAADPAPVVLQGAGQKN